MGSFIFSYNIYFRLSSWACAGCLIGSIICNEQGRQLIGSAIPHLPLVCLSCFRSNESASTSVLRRRFAVAHSESCCQLRTMHTSHRHLITTKFFSAFRMCMYAFGHVMTNLSVPMHTHKIIVQNFSTVVQKTGPVNVF